MLVLLERTKARIEEGCARAGVPYPWWIPLCSTVSVALITVGALIQRDALFPPTPMAAAGVLAISPLLAWSVAGRLVPPIVESLIAATAMAILLLRPAEADFAPLLLPVLAAEVAAMFRLTIAIAAAVPGVAVLVVAGIWGGLEAVPLYIVIVALGLYVGVSLRWQMRALDAERLNHAAEQDQAVAAERQRIAREVHDVVGHSLSITLLHVTGARHALQHDCDVEEAVAALTEAEQVGRAAMRDIRQSVGLLGADRFGTAPLPGADRIADLVDSTRAAGVDVRYHQSGDISTMDTTRGAGLYRIAQESLANIAKHAPSASASVSLSANGKATTLTVRNTLPATPKPVGRGAGLSGMRARADQLGAALRTGPLDGCWIVEVSVPEPAPACPLRQFLP
ncbi:histidine kinase [Actinokineospora sp. HUAS TT18]|uniref:sensor histidine kinase n=1 Tax=Actinokineospora sp. HUAS TT18 TaxID=3447451 RepID=UPI003F51F386